MAPATEQTTIPSRDSAVYAPSSTVLAIRWGFPDPRGMLSPLTAERLLLGRGEECEVRLLGKEISRRHAQIHRRASGFIIEDLHSRNGVFVDGCKVSEAELALGQTLRLGEWIGVVVEALIDVPEPDPVFGLLTGTLAGGPVLRPVLERAKLAASSNLPVVVLGETGTGKEGLSRAIHEWSGRKGPFVAVNCATLVPSLAEAELFGHRRGAFTGADQSRPGYFRAANGGTLLLDEIADIPEPVQAKLLRALQQGEIFPLGESSPVPIDVRVLAATQIPLSQLVNERRFRGDLCARLDGLTIHLPPLRDRKQEIPYLFSHLLRLHGSGRVAEVEPRLVEDLCLYDWPFNLRELDLLVRQLLVLHGREPLFRRSFLPEHLRRGRGEGCDTAKASGVPSSTPEVPLPRSTPAPNTTEYHHARREREMAAFSEALRANKGSVSRAASAIGISRYRAYRLMEAFGMNPGGDDPEDQAAKT